MDFGYDISDFKDVDKTFGTMQDLEELIAKAKKLGVKVKKKKTNFSFSLFLLLFSRKCKTHSGYFKGDSGSGSESYFRQARVVPKKSRRRGQVQRLLRMEKRQK